ncbi:SpoIIE family protein phosphatase [Melioribacter sp. OK-6-Me]|uniref:SpoIIE family protein phosphatase n=1 Tax=unclassified Melioribacter TaxID=2627329 RepID=UPI003EDA56D7
MEELYCEVVVESISKGNNVLSGDVTQTIRNSIGTTFLLADGLGSGLKAHLSAQFYSSQFIALINSGYSLRKAFASLIHTIENAKRNENPVAFLSAIRILNDGLGVALLYDMPPVILISDRKAVLLNGVVHSFYDTIVNEISFTLKKEEGLLILSDGITQAGIGVENAAGWQIEKVVKYTNELLNNGVKIEELPRLILNESKRLWNYEPKDDSTVALIKCRRSKVVNLLTGAPVDKSMDEEVVNKFMSKTGLKIVCGATTAKIIARILGKELYLEYSNDNDITPPGYYIEGIGLVTEGAVTLNQLYNIWGENLDKLNINNPVARLYAYLSIADKINLYWGKAKNPSEGDIVYKQKGILGRDKIIPLLIEKFRSEDKIVCVEEY